MTEYYYFRLMLPKSMKLSLSELELKMGEEVLRDRYIDSMIEEDINETVPSENKSEFGEFSIVYSAYIHNKKDTKTIKDKIISLFSKRKEDDSNLDHKPSNELELVVKLDSENKEHLLNYFERKDIHPVEVRQVSKAEYNFLTKSYTAKICRGLNIDESIDLVRVTKKYFPGISGNSTLLPKLTDSLFDDKYVCQNSGIICGDVEEVLRFRESIQDKAASLTMYHRELGIQYGKLTFA